MPSTAARTFDLAVVGGLLSLAAACTSDRVSFSVVTVRDSTGIAVVENHLSLADAPVWQLSEEPVLEIGSVTGPDEYRFYQIRGAIRLGDGRLAINNGWTREIRFYDQTGKFLAAVGGEGEGSGEYRVPKGPWRMAGDSLAVWDDFLKRMTVLDSEGRFGRTAEPSPSTHNLVPVGVRQDGTWVMRTVEASPGAGEILLNDVTLLTYRPTGELADSVVTLPWWDRTNMSVPRADLRNISLPLGRLFAWRTVVASGPTGIWYADGREHEVRLLDDQGTPLRIVRWEGTDRTILSRHLEAYWMPRRVQAASQGEAALEQLRSLEDEQPVADRFPALSGLIVDGLGDLWVEDYERPGEDTDRSWTVFAPDGQLRAIVHTPGNEGVLEIGADHITTVFAYDRDIWYVRVYRLTRRERAASQTAAEAEYRDPTELPEQSSSAGDQEVQQARTMDEWLHQNGIDPDSVQILEEAQLTESVRAAIVRINSGGGLPTHRLVAFSPDESAPVWQIDSLPRFYYTATFDLVEPDEIIVRGTGSYEREFYQQYFLNLGRQRILKTRGLVDAVPEVLHIHRDTLFASYLFPGLDGTPRSSLPGYVVQLPLGSDSASVRKSHWRSQPVRRVVEIGDTMYWITGSSGLYRREGDGAFQGAGSRIRLDQPPEGIRYLHYRLPQFRVVPGGIEERRLTDSLFIPLNFPDVETLRRARPGHVSDDSHLEIATEIGPVTVYDSKVWFGLKFYDGEGMDGVGGIGWLDPETRQARMIYPPGLADWSVSAIAGNDGAIFVGMASYGEGSSRSGGVGRYDLATGEFSATYIPGLIGRVLVHDATIYALSSDGLFVLDDDRLRRFRVVPRRDLTARLIVTSTVRADSDSGG